MDSRPIRGFIFGLFGTLTYISDNMRGLLQLARSFGLKTPQEAITALSLARAKGFTIKRYCSTIGKIRKRALDCDEAVLLEMWYRAWVDTNLVIFTDVSESLQALRAKVNIAILTSGDNIYEEAMVRRLDIPHHRFLSASAGKKSNVVQILMSEWGTPLVWADSDVREFDALRTAGVSSDEVLAIHMRRIRGAFSHTYRSRYDYPNAGSFSGIDLVLARKRGFTRNPLPPPDDRPLRKFFTSGE